MVFNHRKPNPLSSLHKIQSQCHEYLTTSSLKQNNRNQTQDYPHIRVQASPTQWSPPREGFIKVNSDTAYEQTTGKGFSGILCRNEKGDLISAATTRFFASSPLVSEALSLRDAVSFAVNLHFDHVIFESDNKTLIEVCNDRSVIREIHGIVEDIKDLRSNFVNSELTWIKREGNNCAHTIAMLARDNALLGSWTIRHPPLLRRALVMDAQALWK